MIFISYLSTGKGVQDGVGNQLYIYGYPLPNYLSQEFYNYLPGGHPYSLLNPTMIYDLSNLPINHEVVVFEWKNRGDIPSGGFTLTADWYRERDNFKLFTITVQGVDPGFGNIYRDGSVKWWGWVGYTRLLSSSVYADEIVENGTYRIVVTASGAYNSVETTYFIVTGIDPQVKIEIPEAEESGWISGDPYFSIYASAWGGVGIDYVNFYNSTLGTVKGYSTVPEPYTYPYVGEFNISSLTENTLHQFVARAYDFNGDYSLQVYRNIQIDRTAPVVSIDNVSKTSNSITIDVSATDSGSGQNGFMFYLDNSLKGAEYGIAFTYTFDNLNKGQQYKVGVRAYDNVFNISSQVYQNITTESDSPNNWFWTTDETNAFNNKGLITKLTWGRWNEFLDRVEDFVTYYNGKYGTSVPSVLSHKMTSGDRTLTATRFNGVRFSIGSMNSTGITDRVSGDLVLGSYFITLSQKLNGIT